MVSCPRPYWLLIGWGAATFAPFGPSSRHPLGAGSSAGDVPINPTVRVKEGGNFTFPCSRFTLTLNAFEFLFFLRKKYIYIFRFGREREIFFLFGFDKTGYGEFLNAISPGLSHLGQLFKKGTPTRLGHLRPPPGPPFPLAPCPFL